MIPELNKNALTSAIERIKILEAERDAAVAESNRRDQKWMEVIDSIVGRKLRYTLATITDPPGFDLVPDLQDFIADLRTRLQTAEQETAMLKKTRVDLKTSNLRYAEERDDLRAKLQTAEQQLGQVREEVKRLTEALESTHMGRAVVHWMRAYDSVKCSDDNDENCQILRIPKNLIPKGATLVEAYETAKQFVIIGTPESDDESHNCDAMGCSTLSHVVARVNKSPATPSDGCGKGRMDGNLNFIRKVEDGYFRTVHDVGANMLVMLIWNKVRVNAGLPELTEADLPAWDETVRRYVMPKDSKLLAASSIGKEGGK